MPNLLEVGPFKLFMVMRDCDEPRHVHVTGGGLGEAKTWLDSMVELAANRGCTARELAGSSGLLASIETP